MLDYNTAIVLGGTTLLGASAGAVGGLALLRRRALLGDALSHATLPGICLAFLITGQRDFAVLLAGATVTGLLGVALVAGLRRVTRIRDDAAIGIVLSVFFGAGLALSGIIQRRTPSGAAAGIDTFLLGQTSGMLLSDVLCIGGVAVAVLAAVTLFYKELMLLCFDSDFAAVEGWPVLGLDLAFLVLLTVTTVIGLPAVGVVLMVALLVIPAAAARFWTRRLSTFLVVAALGGAASGCAGTLISAYAVDLPTGPLIVLCAAAAFTGSALGAPHRGLLARAVRTRRLYRQRDEQRLLVALWELCRERTSSGGATNSVELAAQLGLPHRRHRAVLSRARRAGWLQGANAEVRLTEAGVRRAAAVTRAYRLWQRYLLTHAAIDRDLVDPTAEIVEALLPAHVVLELEAGLRAAGLLPEARAT